MTLNPKRSLFAAWVVLVLFLGALSCVKRSDVPPGPDEVEVILEEETVEEAPDVEGLPDQGLTEEGLQAAQASQASDGLKDVYFDFDRYNIKPEARKVLKEDYEILETMPNAEVLVEGHCDNRGTVEYNLALGQRRAESVKDYLISLGMPSSQISTISYGEEMPADPRNTEGAWAKNRRAHIVVLKR